MFKFIAVLLLLPLLALAGAPAAWAAKVGPLDGAAAPSLPPLLTPSLVAETELFNPRLPQELETLGLNEAAILEWARLLPEAVGPDRKLALESLATLCFTLGHTQAAQHWLAMRQSEFATKALGVELLVAQTKASQGAARQALLQDLMVQYPTARTSLEARWAAVWAQAEATGRVTQTWGVPQAAALQTRLAALEDKAHTRYMVAVGLSVVPGLGHLWLHSWATAAMLVLGWGVLGWGFASASRHRHYAYAFMFALLWVALWMNAPMAVGALAAEQAKATRLAAMQGWQDLRAPFSSGN